MCGESFFFFFFFCSFCVCDEEVVVYMCTTANIWLVPLKPLKEAIQEFKAASNDWYLIAFAANNETRIIQSRKLNHFDLNFSINLL